MPHPVAIRVALASTGLALRMLGCFIAEVLALARGRRRAARRAGSDVRGAA